MFLGVNLVTIVRNFWIDEDDFTENSHDVHDGCVTLGHHKLLRFDFLTYNEGNSDLYIGRPEDNPDLFVFSEGHEHYHLKDFNEFKLFNSMGQEAVEGTKQAFCLMDSERIRADAPINPRYHCGDQGVTQGWADLYYSTLPCQYIVIDNLPDGDYTLMATTNTQHVINEDCYSDNTMWSGLRINGNTVTEIPLPWAPEDALHFNTDNVEARYITNRWKVVDGNHWMLDFNQDQTAAERAVQVIKHYCLSYICFVGRPSCPNQEPIQYWLTEKKESPVGSLENEGGINFDPNNIVVNKLGESWVLMAGVNWLYNFGPAEGNAKVALFFIKKYGFTKICFVPGTNPEMIYFRKNRTLGSKAVVKFDRVYPWIGEIRRPWWNPRFTEKITNKQ